MTANPDLTCNPAEGLNHLRRLDPTGVHQLVAIDPEGDEPLAVTTFRLDALGESQASSFLRRHSLSRNVYYSINEVRPDLGENRAKKEDILSIRMIGADLDPVKGEAPAREFQRLDAQRQSIANEPEHFYSFAVATGGGIQIGWRLAEKLSAAQFRDNAEDQTRGILRHLGAEESTADITRLFRLPGTLNFPTPAKRNAGRLEVTRSKAIEYIDGSEIDLTALREWAAPVPAPKSKPGAAAEVDLDFNAVDEVLATGRLPAVLEAKFAAQRQADERLDRLWLGDKSAIGGTDTSGSAFVYALAGRLRRTGLFSVTEFGQLWAVWDHASANLDARQLSRAWLRNNSPAADEEFEATAIKTTLRGGIELEPVVKFDALDIPKRQWVLGTFAAKQYLSGLVSPPGVGKTTFLLMLAVALATGRDDIIGMKVHRRGRVLLWNQEDETDELKRRLLAVMTAFVVKWEDIEDDAGRPRIILGSGVDRRLMFAKRNAAGYVQPAPDAKAIEDFIRAEEIDLAIFDPFVEMHEANENDNPEVAVVGAVFRRVAVKANCAVVLAHHTRKPPAASASDAYAGNMDTARGAGSLAGVARMVATLYTIDKETGKRYGIPEADCRLYVRLDDAKANMALVSGEPRFFKREGVVIGGFGGEEVGVLRPASLTRVKTSSETAAGQNAQIQDAAVALLRSSAGFRLPVTSIADALLDASVVEHASPDALRKRLTVMFEKARVLENGDVVRSETASFKGKPGRSLQLVLEIAENSK
jgi:hypothetical protein